jgi:hypothetical protein
VVIGLESAFKCLLLSTSSLVPTTWKSMSLPRVTVSISLLRACAEGRSLYGSKLHLLEPRALNVCLVMVS